MNTSGLDAFLAPRAIAIIGASDDPNRFGGRALDYLKRHFKGSLVPVNRRRGTVQGLSAVASITQAPMPVDMAIIAVPAPDVLVEARECIALGVKALLVFSAGFGEAGPGGIEMQHALAALCAQHGVRLCGPNCMGIIDLDGGVVATFMRLGDKVLFKGPVGIVSQSGAVGAVLLHEAQETGLGVACMLTSGNEADVTALDWAGALVERADIRVVCLFAEGFRTAADLFQLGRRAAELGKHVLLMKIGGTQAGAQAAFSHTASLAVEDTVLDAVLQRAGIHRAHTIQEMLELAKVLGHDRALTGTRTALVTASGGIGIMVADELERAGVAVSPLATADVQTLAASLPAFASVRNPLDLSAEVVLDNRRMPGIWKHLLQGSASFDAVCMAGSLAGQGPEFRRMMVRAAAESARMLLAWTPDRAIMSELSREGVPALADARTLARAIRLRAEAPQAWARTLAVPVPAFPPASAPLPDDQAIQNEKGITSLEPAACRALLLAEGVPLCREVSVASEQHAVTTAGALGLPVVMKAIAPWLAHKNEHQAVELNLHTGDEVAQAYRRLNAILHQREAIGGKVVVQEMAKGNWELVCGLRRDPFFGPVVSVGLGGVLVEILAQVVFELAPVTETMARDMLARVCDGRLCKGARGLPEDRQRDVAAVICALSRIALARPDVVEIDLNPLIVGPAKITAVDVLVGVQG